MIKVKLIGEGHTLVPYKIRAESFKEVGIEFTDGDSYDLAFVGNNYFVNKKVSLQESTEKGLEALSKITGPYLLIDGQDSSSVIGSYEVFVESNATAMLKYVLLKDKSLYNQEWVAGRYFWGNDGPTYKPKDFDKHSDRILLAGTNWLGTQQPVWRDPKTFPKLIDVNGMFGYPHPFCQEHGLKPSQDFYYNRYRKPVVDIMSKSPFIVAKPHMGARVDFQKWMMYNEIGRAHV